jgi:hypothetical protein
MILYCDTHGPWDTDCNADGCPGCVREDEAAEDVDRQYDEEKAGYP